MFSEKFKYMTIFKWNDYPCNAGKFFLEDNPCIVGKSLPEDNHIAMMLLNISNENIVKYNDFVTVIESVSLDDIEIFLSLGIHEKFAMLLWRYCMENDKHEIIENSKSIWIKYFIRNSINTFFDISKKDFYNEDDLAALERNEKFIANMYEYVKINNSSINMRFKIQIDLDTNYECFIKMHNKLSEYFKMFAMIQDGLFEVVARNEKIKINKNNVYILIDFYDNFNSTFEELPEYRYDHELVKGDDMFQYKINKRNLINLSIEKNNNVFEFTEKVDAWLYKVATEYKNVLKIDMKYISKNFTKESCEKALDEIIKRRERGYFIEVIYSAGTDEENFDNVYEIMKIIIS
jgi:hypothetical protein